MSKPLAVVESLWCGQPRYGCSVCAFDTLDRSRADEHIAHAHYLQPPAKPDPLPVIAAASNGLAPAKQPKE